MVPIDWLPEEQASRIAACVAAIERGAGEKLRAVLLVGGCVPPLRRVGADEAELLVITRDLPMPVLTNLAHQVSQQECAGRVRLHVMTEHEILRATDVYALELADYARRHRLLLGTHPLGDLHLTADGMRRAIERRLRELTRVVREGLLTGVWSDGRLDEARRLFRNGVHQLLIVADHLLLLEGAEPPEDGVALLEAFAQRCGCSATELVDRAKRVVAGDALERPMDALANLLAVTEAATRAVDAMGVGPQSLRT